MSKKSYGETVEKRVKRLFEVLLEHVAYCQCEDNDWGVKLALGEERKLLRVETNLAALVRLTEQKGEKLTKIQVREAIDHYLADYLGILRDERLKKQGAEEWRFSLTLWARCDDKTTNLAKFSEEWHKRRSELSKKAVATPEATARSSAPVAVTAVMNTTLPPVNEWRGRQVEMGELQKELKNEAIRLIGIVAPGGYGKSALAVKLTERLTDWRVLWVNFTEPYSLSQFGRWLLEALGQAYDEKWDEETLMRQMAQGLTKEPCVLVLDNLETVAPTAGDSLYGQFLSRWLGSGDKGKILLTSREQPSFAVNLKRRCHWLRLGGLAEADAIQLVRLDYGFTGTDGELTQFVNQMGRHPLLIQLVCSWMIDEFGEGVSVTASQDLGLNLFDVEGYHRETETSVREVIAASLGRLSAQLGESLTRLSVLRESFDLALAKGVSPEITDPDLRHLARLSLLQEFPPDPQGGKPRRFQLLPLISMAVQEQGDAELLRSAHQSALDYFLNTLQPPPWESWQDFAAYMEGFHHASALGKWQLAAKFSSWNFELILALRE